MLTEPTVIAVVRPGTRYGNAKPGTRIPVPASELHAARGALMSEADYLALQATEAEVAELRAQAAEARAKADLFDRQADAKAGR
jgi:hypothetical protein